MANVSEVWHKRLDGLNRYFVLQKAQDWVPSRLISGIRVLNCVINRGGERRERRVSARERKKKEKPGFCQRPELLF